MLGFLALSQEHDFYCYLSSIIRDDIVSVMMLAFGLKKKCSESWGPGSESSLFLLEKQ